MINKPTLQKYGETGTVFRFFCNKITTTGENGMCLCNDTAIAKKMAKLRDDATRKGKKYWHDEVPFNYWVMNLHAAVGVAQLERINTFLLRKRKNAELCNFYVSELDGSILPTENEWAKKLLLDVLRTFPEGLLSNLT